MAVIDWAAVKDKLAEWAASASGISAHWAGQDQPRPAYPYVLLDIVSGPQQRHHDQEHVFDQVDHTKIRRLVRGDRELVITFEFHISFDGVAYGHATDAFARAEELRSALGRDAARATLAAEGISVLNALGPVANRRTAVESALLSRAGFDVTIGLTALYDPGATGNEDFIERVKATSTVSGHASTDFYGKAGDPTPV